MNIRNLIQSAPLNNFIVAVILVNAVLFGLSTCQKVQNIEEHRLRAPDTSERRLRELVRELDAILNSGSKEPLVQNTRSSPGTASV